MFWKKVYLFSKYLGNLSHGSLERGLEAKNIEIFLTIVGWFTKDFLKNNCSKLFQYTSCCGKSINVLIFKSFNFFNLLIFKLVNLYSLSLISNLYNLYLSIPTFSWLKLLPEMLILKPWEFPFPGCKQLY